MKNAPDSDTEVSPQRLPRYETLLPFVLLGEIASLRGWFPVQHRQANRRSTNRVACLLSPAAGAYTESYLKSFKAAATSLANWIFMMFCGGVGWASGDGKFVMVTIAINRTSPLH